MHLYGTLLGVMVGIGVLAWIATTGAFPLGAPVIAGFATLGTYVAFVAGYGAATLDTPARCDRHG